MARLWNVSVEYIEGSEAAGGFRALVRVNNVFSPA